MTPEERRSPTVSGIGTPHVVGTGKGPRLKSVEGGTSCATGTAIYSTSRDT